MLFREIINVYTKNHIKHVDTLYGKAVAFLNVKQGGTHILSTELL
jgi:hypothetical protein